MPIPEQFARVWLATLLITYGIYFALVPRVDTGSMWSQLLAFGMTAVAQAVIMAVASAWMELRHRGGMSATAPSNSGPPAWRITC